MEIERIVQRLAALMARDPIRRRMGERVRAPDEEALEGEARVERRAAHLGLAALRRGRLMRRHGAALGDDPQPRAFAIRRVRTRFDPDPRSVRGLARRRAAYPDADPLDRGVLAAVNREH